MSDHNSLGDYSKISQLGASVKAENSPITSVIEAVPNMHSDVNYVARFCCPEFTSLCPVTSQPDYATMVIDYVPNEKLIESKSLKLFLQSFRNHNDFHEACTVYIAKRLIEVAQPRWFRINAYWYPRGGIPIDVFYQTGEAPKDVHIEPINVGIFKGR